MQKQFILPTSESDVDMKRWLIPLRTYGVDLLMLADNALNSILNDGANHCDEVIRYVNDSVAQNFEVDPDKVGGEIGMHVDKEVARMCDYAVTAVDVLAQHMRPYVFSAETQMCEQGADPKKLVWNLSGSVGDDILVTVAEEVINGVDGSDFRCTRRRNQ